MVCFPINTQVLHTMKMYLNINRTYVLIGKLTTFPWYLGNFVVNIAFVNYRL